MNRTSTRSTDTSRFILLFLVAIYALLSLGLIFSVPIGNAPDESAHLEYVKFIADNNALPVFEPRGAPHPGYEFHQPPLFYLVSALFWKISPAEIAPYTCRIVSMLCSAASLWLIWNAIICLFPKRRELAVVATGFAALWPLHVAVGSFAGNDSIADLVCTAMFWKMAQMSAKISSQTSNQNAPQNSDENATSSTRSVAKITARDAIVVGVLVGLGILSKNTTVVIGAVAIVTLWLLARKNGESEDATHGGKMLLIGVAVSLLVGGAWLWRNTVLYGDAFAFRIFDEAFSKSSPRPSFFFTPEATAAFRQQITLPIYLRALFLITFATCWGFFGGPGNALRVLNVFGASGARAEAAVWWPIGALFLVATIVVFVGLARAFAGWKRLNDAHKTAISGWIFGAILVLLAFVYFNTTQFQGQARYLHPALLPVAFGVAVGWTQVFRSRRALIIASGAMAILMIVMTLTNIFVWRVLA